MAVLGNVGAIGVKDTTLYIERYIVSVSQDQRLQLTEFLTTSAESGQIERILVDRVC